MPTSLLIAVDARGVSRRLLLLLLLLVGHLSGQPLLTVYTSSSSSSSQLLSARAGGSDTHHTIQVQISIYIQVYIYILYRERARSSSRLYIIYYTLADLYSEPRVIYYYIYICMYVCVRARALETLAGTEHSTTTMQSPQSLQPLPPSGDGTAAAGTATTSSTTPPHVTLVVVVVVVPCSCSPTPESLGALFFQLCTHARALLSHALSIFLSLLLSRSPRRTRSVYYSPRARTHRTARRRVCVGIYSLSLSIYLYLLFRSFSSACYIYIYVYI